MNLEWKHFPLIVLGGLTGAGLGWLVWYLFELRGPLALESVFGLHGIGAVFGSIAGLGFAVVAIFVRAARDPNVGCPLYFTQFNGIETTLIGRTESRDDGSYVTTEWFTLFWLPVFPVCRYRVTQHAKASAPFSTLYTIHEKLPMRLQDARRVYGIAVLVLLGFIGFAYFMFR